MKLRDLLGKKYEEWKKKTQKSTGKKVAWAVSRRGEVSIYEIPNDMDICVGYIINDEDIVFAVGRSNEVEYTAKTIKEYALEKEKILQRLTLRNQFDDDFYMELKGGLQGAVMDVFRKREPREIGNNGIGFTGIDGKGDFISVAVFDVVTAAALPRQTIKEMLEDTSYSVIVFGTPYMQEHDGKEYKNFRAYGIYCVEQ